VALLGVPTLTPTILGGRILTLEGRTLTGDREIIHFDTMGIIGSKKLKSTHLKSNYCRRSFLSTTKFRG